MTEDYFNEIYTELHRKVSRLAKNIYYSNWYKSKIIIENFDANFIAHEDLTQQGLMKIYRFMPDNLDLKIYIISARHGMLQYLKKFSAKKRNKKVFNDFKKRIDYFSRENYNKFTTRDMK